MSLGTRWVTFDCFGTLIDWRAGFLAALAPLVGDRASGRGAARTTRTSAASNANGRIVPTRTSLRCRSFERPPTAV